MITRSATSESILILKGQLGQIVCWLPETVFQVVIEGQGNSSVNQNASGRKQYHRCLRLTFMSAIGVGALGCGSVPHVVSTRLPFRFSQVFCFRVVFLAILSCDFIRRQ